MHILNLILNFILILFLTIECSASSFSQTEAKNSTYIHVSDVSSNDDTCMYEQNSNTNNHSEISDIKTDLYATLDSIDLFDDLLPSPRYLTPASYYFPETYKKIAAYGIEAVPYILEYVIECWSTLTEDEESFYVYQLADLNFFLSTAYEMLEVKGQYYVHWIHPDTNESVISYDNTGMMAQYLLDYINENGLRPIYPFLSAEEAAANQDRITRQLEFSDNDFNWYLTKDFTRYQNAADLVTVFGEYAVPYVLDYILSYEGKDLTPDEEMNLGVLLHLSYHMLGVETTARWHMPAEPVASTTDPFPYAHELVAHLGEYGLEPVPHK